jgi:AraC family transcriptional regulator, regulatory protein of adaptative response / DNA-3-methyladenine glycosylase II
MVSRALKLIEGGALDEGDIASVADRLEIGERQLRRLFRRHLGAAPITVAQTRRVLLAKQLLHQTDLSMIEVALASGFSSVRRFNETFRWLYQRPPGELRRHATASSPAPEISLLLPYRPPYDWTTMIRFLEARAIAGLELVTKNSYSRVIELRDAVGSITVSHAPEQCALRVAVRFPRLSLLPVIIARVRRMFDLSADPVAIASVLSLDPVMAPLVSARPGLRVPGGWEGFEVAVRAVVGQQISLKFATQLASRVVSAIGTLVPDRVATPGLTHAFPRPERFNVKTLSRLGIPAARAGAIVGVATALAGDPHLFDPRRDLAEAVSRLRRLRGIGEWTAQYIAMRALGESDAFLAGDVGVQKQFALRGRRLSASQLLAHAERWRPWRAYAVLHLWMADKDPSQTSLDKENDHALAA